MTDTLVGRLLGRLQRDRRGNFDPELSVRMGPGLYEEIMEAAKHIEYLERLAAPPDTVKFVESVHRIQSAADDYRKRALAAESSLLEAVKAAREDEREGCALVAENAYTGRTNTGTHPLQIARAIRSRTAVLDSESGSTQKERPE